MILMVKWLLLDFSFPPQALAEPILEQEASSLSVGEGDGNPHQYSCLEDPMDGGAW